MVYGVHYVSFRSLRLLEEINSTDVSRETFDIRKDKVSRYSS